MRVYFPLHQGVILTLEHYGSNFAIDFQLYNPNWEYYARHRDWVGIAYGFPKRVLDIEDIF
jgi:hypothetical protein